MKVKQEVERGEKSPGWYLNRSQLYDWTLRYALILRQETDPSQTSYEKEFPLDGIDLMPSEMRVHYHLVWDQDEMGQSFISGESDINKAYYITTDKAWAKAPRQLSYYFDGPGGPDVSGHMDLNSVFWLLGKDNPQQYMNEYFNMPEGKPVDDE